MSALLAALDHPERAFPSVLVAGTKGKGSTVAMLSACLQAKGLRTGRYTSPHLVNWRERTCINAQPISVDSVLTLAEPIHRAVDALAPALGPPTTFEVGTAFAFAYFARGQESQIDLAVVEVGTGGRFDATNLLEPAVSVITSISYDHTPTLGGTLSEIAWHKAGILRQGRPGVLAPQVDEARLAVEREAHDLGAPVEEVGREWSWSETGGGSALEPIRITSTHADFDPLTARIGLLGDHQRDNATTAVAALHALGAVEPRFNVGRPALQAGLADVDWPGRLQVLSERPLLVLDGAHNAASAEVLRSAIDTIFQFKRLHLVVGLSEGKDARGVLAALSSGSQEPAVYLTRSRHERSASPLDLEPLVHAASPRAAVSVHADLAAALDTALAAAASDDLVLVTGSLFLIGEALVWWRRSPR
ncbi:MAG: bifunctional folylpolyglutamate synthase/dihydrofolate synthase [Chloroflexota bacterium]|nr:bifunctional folylpolyglutamate synthase/dihydrofolate synthase [Chloroflexota bacterium]